MKSARHVLRFMLVTYRVISVTHEDCIKALSISIKNYEDALISACAKKAITDYIISRDVDFLQGNKPVLVIEPKDFLKKLQEE